MRPTCGVALALALASTACGSSDRTHGLGEDGIPVAAVTTTQAYAGGAFLCDFIHQPFPRIIIEHLGREEARSFTETGATRGNAEWAETGAGDLNVESQRGAYHVIAAGLLTGDADLLDRGLRGLEWGLAQQGPDGSFPEERAGTTEKNSALHAKSQLIEAAARSLRLLHDCGLDAVPAPRVAALGEALARSARWLAATPDLDAFWVRAGNTNQRLFVVAALRESSLLLADDALGARASALLDDVLAAQLDDGTFVEAGGFDASYQTVSLDLLTQCATSTTDPRRVVDALQRGVDRFLRVIRADGTVDAEDSTRTAACGEPQPGRGPKGKDIDIVPLRLYQAGFLLGTLPTLLPIANRIEGAGQGFDHAEDCD